MQSGPNEMLLSWFQDDELRDCPKCGRKHLLPPWGSPTPVEVCVTCGILSMAAGVASLDS
jgi:hypothetical protein